MSRPRIFIGSSSESLDVANAVQQNLDQYAEVTIWTQGVFQLSTPVITSLVKAIDNFDFAIFVFSPDDISIMRDNAVSSVRDNVIYETGLFSGKLGIERVFFVKPRNQADLHLPTDLLGMKAGEYDAERSDGNLVAATGPFCNMVRQQINMGEKTDTRGNSETNTQERHESDFQVLATYMAEKNWTSMSFEKILENIHPRFTEEYLMKLVEVFPNKIRRCKLKGAVPGIKIMQH